MSKTNEKKRQQLGMAFGTAGGRLRKMIMFKLMGETNQDICFQCGEKIEVIENLSIEHKKPWMDSKDPIKLFFDLDNVAFSHLKCNVGSGRRKAGVLKHGTYTGYSYYRCRCGECREAKRLCTKEYRERVGKK